jgi:hypothetical protein
MIRSRSPHLDALGAILAAVGAFGCLVYLLPWSVAMGIAFPIDGPCTPVLGILGSQVSSCSLGLLAIGWAVSSLLLAACLAFLSGELLINLIERGLETSLREWDRDTR